MSGYLTDIANIAVGQALLSAPRPLTNQQLSGAGLSPVPDFAPPVRNDLAPSQPSPPITDQTQALRASVPTPTPPFPVLETHLNSQDEQAGDLSATAPAVGPTTDVLPPEQPPQSSHPTADDTAGGERIDQSQKLPRPMPTAEGLAAFVTTRNVEPRFDPSQTETSGSGKRQRRQLGAYDPPQIMDYTSEALPQGNVSGPEAADAVQATSEIFDIDDAPQFPADPSMQSAKQPLSVSDNASPQRATVRNEVQGDVKQSDSNDASERKRPPTQISGQQIDARSDLAAAQPAAISETDTQSDRDNVAPSQNGRRTRKHNLPRPAAAQHREVSTNRATPDDETYDQRSIAQNALSTFVAPDAISASQITPPRTATTPNPAEPLPTTNDVPHQDNTGPRAAPIPVAFSKLSVPDAGMVLGASTMDPTRDPATPTSLPGTDTREGPADAAARTHEISVDTARSENVGNPRPLANPKIATPPMQPAGRNGQRQTEPTEGWTKAADPNSPGQTNRLTPSKGEEPLQISRTATSSTERDAAAGRISTPPTSKAQSNTRSQTTTATQQATINPTDHNVIGAPQASGSSEPAQKNPKAKPPTTDHPADAQHQPTHQRRTSASPQPSRAASDFAGGFHSPPDAVASARNVNQKGGSFASRQTVDPMHVRVSIGTIEIGPTDPKPSATPSSKPSAKMSLTDYRKRRD